MITVKVTYTVKPSYVATNRENISRFLEDFKQLSRNDFRYNVYIAKDGKTFVHISQYRNEAIQKQLLEVPSFKSFQQQRDASGLEGEPTIEVLETAGRSHEEW